MKSNDMKRQQPMPFGILLLIHYFTFTFLACWGRVDQKNFGGNRSHSQCLSPELKYVFPILFHIGKAV